MAIPKKYYELENKLRIEYGNNWERIPETDERLLKMRLLLEPNYDTKRKNRVGRGSRKILWTEEMDDYLTENDGKTLAELSRLMDISAQSISRRRIHLGMKNVKQTETDGGIIYTDADGNEHVYASVTLARIATRLPRKNHLQGIENWEGVAVCVNIRYIQHAKQAIRIRMSL